MMQVISPAPRDAWRSVIADDFDALPEHAPEWLDTLVPSRFLHRREPHVLL